ncbi:hypothetical protein B0I37DRAFT_100353 [Chaetomium sp. MPI-CAGE-AT-0009]|nr:hypothetical protein B0I37DRAFT_100353 [Chaetomium sp. MPI-CAGE-AT-0009]
MDGGCITNSSLLFASPCTYARGSCFCSLPASHHIQNTRHQIYSISTLYLGPGWFGLVWLGLAGKTKKNVASDVLGFLSGCFVVLPVWGVDRGGKYQVLFFFPSTETLVEQFSSHQRGVQHQSLGLRLYLDHDCVDVIGDSAGSNISHSASQPAS